jgi:transposase
MRDRASKPYLRERAAALLQIAQGYSPHQVATEALGVLKPRDPDTVYAWLDRYEAEGVTGLYIRDGRGRKPAFSPSGGTGSA